MVRYLVVSLAGLACAGLAFVILLVVLVVMPLAMVVAPASAQVRSQVDTVGFAMSWADMEAVLAASLEAEGLAGDTEGVSAPDEPASPAAVAAIIPHDDYLYAGRTAVHALPYLQAKRWVIVGVCHACRRIGVRDRLLFDSDSSWRVAGREWPVDVDLRDALMSRLGDRAEVDDERHAVEHSVEALLPWLGSAVPEVSFVPILVAGMELDTLREAAVVMARALAEICHENGWQAGRDLGILISADAVHYGCEGWGGGGYSPFGCDATGHAAGRRQDITLAEATLAGPLSDEAVGSFVRLVWDPTHPEYPDYPYRITWCGLYSIPFGLTVAARWQEEMGGAGLVGSLLRYGDSVSDGRLDLPSTQLGVTAPNTLEHWVGYPAVVYLPSQTVHPVGGE